MMNNKKKIILYGWIACCLMACGDQFSTGGASIGGSGNPKPGTLPTDQNDPSGVKIKLSAAVEDLCSGMHRQMRFINRATGEPIEQETVLDLSKQKDREGYNVQVELTVTNVLKTNMAEVQPACYIPIALYNNTLPPVRIAPNMQCEHTQLYHYAPNESKVFVLPYSIANNDEQYAFYYGEDSHYLEDDQKLDQCEPLRLPFSVVSNVDQAVKPSVDPDVSIGRPNLQIQSGANAQTVDKE